ncbi:TetR/AcrR family transcriptional regulator [Kineococcus rhizosphaerae]|uniref:TetR family transcriptional regulator n=1 Tax=Kineococcus rhizosphaerae TaxID=559628 RepID=A0A2T0R1V9_9ACTN|nr:TetR/AcrR family transcriptional regulator [Kineococcus rhizosphaerae]PRY13549.1 TetR family transcriptional regulator [Kineococcus rhizosphaerae]
MTTGLPQVLRSDARDNRERVLQAARELFAERGLDVTVREVARRAGVGPATLYRRFPAKQDLLEAAFAEEVRRCSAVVDEGCADPDPWSGFSTIVEQVLVVNSRNQGFTEAFTAADPHEPGLAAHRHAQVRRLRRLMARAREAGDLRADATVDDFVLVLQAGRALSAVPARRRTAAARRLARIALDGLRAR